jgi:hypothetical protein
VLRRNPFFAAAKACIGAPVFELLQNVHASPSPFGLDLHSMFEGRMKQD